MPDALSPTDIVKWFRDQARVFNGMADTIESTFKLGAKKDTATPTLPTLGAVTIEQVKEALSEKAMRVADLAKQFSVPAYEVERIVSHSDIFERGSQGWIKVKDDKAQKK